MKLKAGEIKSLYFDVKADVNAAPFTVIAIKFIAPDLTETERTNPLVTAPIVDSPVLDDEDEEGIILPANTYFLYRSQAGEFVQLGTWTACTRYEDAQPSLVYGDSFTFTVEAPC